MNALLFTAQKKVLESTHPPRLDVSGFDQSALREIALAKIEELKRASKTRETIALTKEPFAYWATNSLKKYSKGWFLAQIYLYNLEKSRDSFRIWLKYWERVGGLYKKPNFGSGLSDTDIQRAREYPLEQLLGEWRKVGSKIFSLCPFHEEHHGSFCIYPDNSWHCFGCNEHGNNAIDYLTKKENLDFKEAVRRLL